MKLIKLDLCSKSNNVKLRAIDLMADIFSLNGKKAIITGASSGIGKRISYTLARAGAEVIMIARRRELLKEIANFISSDGYKASIYVLDITKKREQLEYSFQKIISDKKIDIFINCAGFLAATPILKKCQNEFFDIFSVNVFSVWNLTQIIAQHMIDKKISGSIIYIGSVSALEKPGKEYSAYNMSKASILSLTKSLVGELSLYNIRVNTVSPGWIETEMTKAMIKKHEHLMKKLIPLNFIGQPSDLDGIILYLASNTASHYVTGSNFIIDGGLTWNGI